MAFDINLGSGVSGFDVSLSQGSAYTLTAEAGSYSLTEVSNSLYERTPRPSVILDFPSDTGGISDTTPTFLFTGADPANAQDLQYQIQIDTVNTFDTLTSTYDVKYIDLYMYAPGVADDSIQIVIYSGNFESVSIATSDSIDHVTIGEEASWLRFTFATPVTLTHSTTYYLVAQGSSVRDTVNTYVIQRAIDTYSGQGASRDTGTWNSFTSGDNLAFRAYDVNLNLLASAEDPIDTFAFVHRGSSAGVYEKSGQTYTAPRIPLLDKLSLVSATGFANEDNGGDTAPWTSGDQMSYTVQGADELSETTYYWRVRAYNVTTEEWGDWSEIRSFTISAAIILTADSGTYTLSGTDANLEKGSNLVADFSVYNLSGTTVAFYKDSPLSANSGTYTLTGDDANLEKGYRLVAESGSFSLTGENVNFSKTYILSTIGGIFGLSTQESSLTKQYFLVSDPGTFSELGQEVTLLYNRYLSANPNDNMLSGEQVNLLFNRTLGVDSAIYNLTPQDPSFLYDRILHGDIDNYVLSGEDSQLLQDKLLTSNSGEYTLTGEEVTLDYVPFNRVIANLGNFTLSGTPSTSTKWNRVLKIYPYNLR